MLIRDFNINKQILRQISSNETQNNTSINIPRKQRQLCPYFAHFSHMSLKWDRY